MKVNLGGERLGSGAKIKVDLHNWGRSTFNQDRIWRSTMGVGTLVPCFTEIGTTGTTFDINIKTLAHTIPTIAPCFGSYKLQVDFFACPFRLYQGLLHNNAVNIGLDMNKVLFPNIILGTNNNTKKIATNTSSLLNYLGIKGYTPELKVFKAMPILCYYDIFKNYYSNKQEPNAKQIVWEDNNNNLTLPRTYIYWKRTNNDGITYNTESVQYQRPTNNKNSYILDTLIPTEDYTKISLEFTKEINPNYISELMLITDAELIITKKEEWVKEKNEIKGNIFYESRTNTPAGNFIINNNKIEITFYYPPAEQQIMNVTQIVTRYTQIGYSINDFPLENIDKARREILKKSDKNERIVLNTDLNFEPYKANFENNEIESNIKEMNGLMLKTYNSDIFNNWLSNENIQLINNLSSIQLDNDNPILSIDALILAKKVYNVLNRIAVAGGTYEDWQESVYGEANIRKAESPIYIGGASSEIAFEEVVSTAEANGDPLGTLGGRGQMTDRKGGNITYKCEEPTIIMGIASITPRIDYHQGNKWYMTELDNMDNLHKPGLDGIGFQNLIANNVVWSDSTEKALAKQTAWLNYQTSYNEVFGYFALKETDPNYLGYMTLRRDFEVDGNGEITDFTTYINPEKFNKVFASQELTAQNFWVQLGFDCKSRRKMAAYEIPNL